MSYYEWIARESARIDAEEARIRRACVGEDCEAPGIHKTCDGRWLCTRCARDSDEAFPATCQGCDEDFDASYAMYSGDEAPYCSDECGNRDEADEIKTAYRYGR